jgi:hypothetical protein
MHTVILVALISALAKITVRAFIALRFGKGKYND